ncbi:MAG: ferritin-like domain-containing protein, partial [Actinomycetota bacterium]|nr:ferritin-like domain-containing protein [Actinomycetota bacterium]
AERNRATVGRFGGSTRRNFLVGAGAVAGGLVLAACSSKKSSTSTTGTTAPGSSDTSAGGGGLTGDLAVANLAAGLENLAVQTYQKAIDAVTSNALQGIPMAIVVFAQTAQKQHKDHAAAWNSILTSAGKPAQSGVDITVRDAYVTPMFPTVKDAGTLGTFALGLEDAAGATYLFGIQNALTDPGAIKIAATIQPVEMQHSAILNLVLGKYPVPNSFAQTTGHANPTDMIG